MSVMAAETIGWLLVHNDGMQWLDENSAYFFDEEKAKGLLQAYRLMNPAGDYAIARVVLEER